MSQTAADPAPRREKSLSWPIGGIALVAIAIVLLALPARVEGPILLPISPGHALTVLDTVALLPMLAGIGWLYAGLWRRRSRLGEKVRTSPGWSGLGIFVAGLGLGLMLASAYSSFFWWWAVGAVLWGVMLVVTLVAAARR